MTPRDLQLDAFLIAWAARYGFALVGRPGEPRTIVRLGK